MKAKTFIGLTLLTAVFCLISVAASAATISAAPNKPPTHEQRVAALESAVATLQTTVSTLQGQVNTLQAQVNALQANSVLALGPYLTVDTTKKLVLFQGVNLQLVNGANATNSRNGLGNLIIGYNLPRNDGRYFCSDGQYTDQGACEGANETWAVSLKTGSHYFVIGDYNNYSQWGGLVVGSLNTSNGPYASVSGGGHNTASVIGASVSGGIENTAGSLFASVSGGGYNTAYGNGASVSGGFQNFCNGEYGSVSGGSSNTVGYDFASVSGGQENTASGEHARVEENP